MGKSKSVMPFHVNDWLSSPRVGCFSAVQQVGYLRLLLYCWASGNASLPDDDTKLALWSQMGDDWLTSGKEVRACFTEHPTVEGCLTNPRLHELWFGKGKRTTKKLDMPPTVGDVRAYCAERKNNVDAERFCAYYSANGWVQGNGKKPIRDWKAAVRTWEKRSDWSAAPSVKLTDPDHIARRALLVVTQSKAKIGADRAVHFEDTAINAAVLLCGGWVRVCDMADDELHRFYWHEFRKAYASVIGTDMAQYNVPLRGRRGVTNPVTIKKTPSGT